MKRWGEIILINIKRARCRLWKEKVKTESELLALSHLLLDV
jgi:hypothetical protein